MGKERRKERKRERQEGKKVDQPPSTTNVEICESPFSNHQGSTGGDHRQGLLLVFPCKVKLQIEDQE